LPDATPLEPAAHGTRQAKALLDSPIKQFRVVLADEHSLVRQGLSLLLSSDPELEVVGEAGDGLQAVELARTLRPDVAVLDVLLPLLNGAEASKRIAKVSPDTRVLGMSGFSDALYVREMMRAGALGCLLKQQDQEDFVEAVRSVARGKRYVSPKISAWMLQNEGREGHSSMLDLLTLRELEILKLLAQGKTNKEVAAVLNRSLYTVDAHRGRIMEKLDLHSAGEIVRFALRHGLIE
jgi:DNA-binding NarL/FixJ family response regulator